MTALHSGASSAVVSDLGALTQDFSQMAEYAAVGEETGAYDDALAQTKVHAIDTMNLISLRVARD